MFRRWLIRIFTLALLSLCVGVWVRSYSIAYIIDYNHGDKFRVFSIASIDGLLEFSSTVNLDSPPEGLHFHTVYSATGFSETNWLRASFPASDSFPTAHYFLGFYIVDAGIFFYIGIPFWFLTSILGMAFIYSWRKTRPKQNPAGAFPVQINDASKISN